MSAQHTFESRRRFAECVQRGEAGVNLAEAVLHIAAEDDAIVSHSAVAFPVDAYLGRVERMVDELARLRLAHLPPGEAEPAEVLAAVDAYLYTEKRLGLGGPGKSAIPAAARVAHPGVWEEPRRAYLNELLTRRVGTPACLAILYAEVMQRLLQKGAVDFAVRMECPSFNELPRAVVLPGLTRASLARPDGSLTNTCTMDALYEVLIHLKRSYWPYGWDSTYTEGGASFASYGGFDAAARVAVEGMQSAEMEAISRTAAHRLSRGIWTSPGAGDLRRARAAAERICMLVGDQRPAERRDAAVLLIHSGEFAQGRAELDAYLASPEARSAPSETRILVDRLRDKTTEMLSASGELSAALPPVITAKSVLQRLRPVEDVSELLDLPW